MPNSSFFSTVSNKTGNSTDLDIQFDSNFAFLMFSLILAMTWVLYITYYNSRVVGYFITRLLTRFYVKKGYLSIGSFTVCALSGKIMFRDIVYITDDYTVRIQDGWLIFRWWRAYVPKDVSEDLSHSDTRLSVMLNGYELHIYNRCKVYSRLEQVFGLDPVIIPPNEMEPEDDLVEKEEPPSLGKSWRDLIPVIKVDVSSGRVVFGNRLVPTTLSINVEEAHFMYSTKPAASKLDHFMHFVKCKAENFKVILAPSPKYMGISDEPPRYMGAGFVVLSSNNMDLYFYMDEPGLVPREPHMLELANGEMVESAAPMWGVDIKCGKGTDFSYGPWADRQREHLFKFFFPQDCQTMVPTPAPQPGERRSVQSFDVRLSTLHESTIDLLFSKNKETNAVHVNVGQGSYLEMTLPWIIGSDGYTTKVTGQLLHFEATTSLTFRSLVESETLEFAIRSHYPLRWNDHQEWLLNLTGCKASGYFIYAHKDFFQDMINDWSTKSKPDLLHFVPYTWRLTVLLKEFELITLANESNWIDCSSQHQENSHIAICGDLFDFSFDLPFDDFLPATLPLRFWIQGESVDLALFLPEVYSSRLVVESMDRHAKLQARDGTILHPRPQDNARKWRNICKRSGGWIDCWSIPIAAISINWIYHPMPAFGPPPQADITTPEKEEILLSPMRIPRSRKATGFTWPQDGNPKFDPTTLPADKVSLELEIGPSVMYLYGSWLRNFYFLKESIFGEDQQFTDMNSTTTPRDSATAASNPTNTKPNHTTSAPADSNLDTSCGEDEISLKKEFDPRVYRPLDVIVSITMHDIQAHLMKNCTDNDPACPVILIERFGFEMKKSYKETLLQLLLSPAILITTDRVLNRTSKDKHLQQGHLMLSGLQIRGHAMFSDTGRSLDQETLEYAWQLEIQLGKLSGKFTSPQLYHVITGLETLVLLITDPESKLQAPRLPPECHHGIPPLTCPESDADGKYRCPSGDDIKYRMTRVCIDAIDLYLIESGTALNLWASPLRLATCNLHGNHVKAGVTAVLPAVRLRQLICAGQQQQATNSSAGGGVGGGVNTSGGGGGGSSSNTNTSGSNRSQTRGNDVNDLWLEIASISGGPLMLESVSSMCETDKSLHLVQAKYLKMHDERYKRLWFLWPSDSKSLVTGKCGCVGGCVFFGRNRNGQRFFKPSRQDLADGVNIAAYKINDSKDPGFGQSILHESQLVFHTPPYNAPDVAIHDYPPPSWGDNKPPPPSAPPPNQLTGESYLGREMTGSTGDSTASPSPASSVERRPTLPRRFSYNNASLRTINGVPYARLIDSSPTGTLPHRLDSDSRLHTARSILSVPESNEAGLPPKSSVSDSRLAVDYFVAPAPNLGTGTDDIPAASESEQSLYNSGGEATGALPPYPRTVSLCSENQSDVFFSAEEELSHQLASTASATDHPSRSGSLKLSLSNPTASKKRFGSDMNILANSAEAVPSSATIGNLELGATRQPLYRSDHEIHTPEHRDEMRLLEDTPLTAPPRIPDLGSEDWHHHRGSLLSNVMPRSVSPRLLASSLNGLAEADPLLMDSSDSISSTSFISAVSSQEDLALVNLHMQVNKPIIDSPLLMATYINHLSQISCSNWTQVSLPAGSDAFTVPLFQRSSDGRLVFIGSKYLPKFDTITEGFTCLKMVTRSSPGMGTNKDKEASSATRTPTCAYPWDSQVEHCVKKLEEIEASSKQGPQEELLSMRNECGTKTTVVVKMKGDIDIFITPLSLESLQRFIDALTPTLASVHPLTVLNHLHMSCIGVVEAANVLKRDQYLSQLQGGGSKRSTAERKSKPGDQVPCHTYEETIASQVQGSIVLPKINIAVLQVSVVEEVIAFSALDNIRDLTCVSFLAICLEGITTRFHIGKESREIVQTFHRPTVTPSGKKNNVFKAAHKAFLLGHSSSNNTGQDNKVGEPVYIETSERTQEETVITLHVSRLHMQLRRLQNQSSLLQEAVITAIPLHCSRAMFSVTKPTSSTEPTNIHQTSSTAPKPNPGTPNSTKSTAANTTKPNATATTTSKSNSAGTTSVTTKPNDTTITTSKPTGTAVVSAKPNTTVVTSSKPAVSGSAGKPNSSSTSGTTATKPNSSGSTTANTTGKPNSGSSSAANNTNKPNSGSSSAAHSTAKPNSNVSGGSAVSGSGEVGGTSGCQEKEDSWASLAEDKMGFIMMECGLEGVSFKVVKRSKFEREEDSNDSKDKTEIVAETTGDSKIVRDDVSSETINISHVKPEEVTSSSTPKGSRTPAPAPGANGTGNGDTTDSATQPTPGGDTSKALVPLIDANASSCVIDVKSVWFNFAAPPRTPITRSKIAYTRLDWNLLSTASPGITAWMNPSNRCVIRGVHALRCRYRRSTAVVTCLMSQALDESSVHMPVKSRYGRFTPMAKTLQEDPSCQLCNILKKYLLKSTTGIEANLKEPDLPHLSTLRQGVIVLSRQWKNILYTPLLLEHNFKIKNHPMKPMNVTFAIPDPEEENMTDDPDDVDPDTEVTDECAMLLQSQFKPPHGIIKLPAPPSGGDETSTVSPPPHTTQHSSPTSPLSHLRSQSVCRKKKCLLPSQPPSSSRASIVFPLLTGCTHHHYRHLSDHKPPSGGYASLKDEEKLRGNLQGNSTNSLYSSIPLPLGPDSLGSLEQAMLTSPPHASSHQTDGKEDLYTWMTKQQEDNDVAELSDTLTKTNKATYWDTSKLASSSTGTEATVLPGVVPSGPAPQSPPLASPDLTLLAASGYSLYPMHDNLRLLDAHLIFEPLLASLGVMPQQMISTGGAGSSSAGSLDSWGSNLSVAGTMGSMRVDIVESEVEKSGAGEAWKKNKSDESTKFRLELAPDTGAFLCERVHIGCEVRRAADLTLVEDLSRQRRNMLYVSRGQLKKHANTALNVSVSVRYISQQVTMPLLRLLHQISNMYTNVKVTQSELRDQVAPPLAKSPAPPPLGLGRLPPELFDKHKALVQADVKPVVSPSASVRSKHQSFVQKLRSTSKSVRGYMNLGDPPRDILPGILSGTAPLPLTEGRDSPSKQKPDDLPPLSTPRCWKTVYYLLDLYATMPETKTVAHRISMGAADVSDNFKPSQNQSANTSAKKPDDIDLEKGEGVHIPPPSTPTPIPAGPPQYSGPAREDRARLIVFAVARIHRTRLLATLSGLKLEAEITNLHSSLTYRKKTRPPSLECSLTGHLGRTMIVLLEGVAPNQQTVVKVTVDKSQALISSMSRRTKDKNSGFITIDRINIDIPQHPVVLHGMMTRGSKQLSSTLQELRVTRTSSRMSRGTTVDDVDSVPSGLGRDPPNTSPPHPREPPPRPPPPMVNTTEVMSNNLSTNTTTNPLLSPFVMHFTGLIQSVTFTAALLPSLQAQYRMDQLSSAGVTGSKAKFVIDLPRHSLSFSTKVQVTEANLPSEASIDLPKIHVSAEYIQDGGNRPGDIPPTEGVTYRQGSYMSAVADIGIFEHSLTTDLLNHLVFVQKVFMKEVNEVIQKVYGGEKPVPIWEEDEPSSVSLLNYILFSLIVRVKRVQLTATTPTNSAVRLETGSIELQLSNRIQNMSGASNNAGAKLFLKTHVDVNLSLGQVIRNVLFEEADPEFQHYAFFKTQIALRNAFQGEMIQPGSSSDDKEVILISLTRPLVYIQPVAVDKAILVWLNYKNAYDYWTEQCTDPGGNGGTGGNMMSNIASGLEKFSAGATTSTMGTLFLHLTVDDMGICVPLNPLPLTTWGLNRSLFMENDSCSAVVITLESTSIEACSSGSLVSKGQFIGLCLRFADDFETSLDDWKPDPSNDPSALMNLCVVSEGTYEVCSRTTTLKSDTENAKWFLNVKWQMEGVDIHLDVNIGKQLSALGHTLTTLTGVQEDETLNAYCDSDEDDDNTNNSQDSIVMKTKSRGTTECLSPLANPHLDPKKRSKLLEKEMYEQVKIISDLRALGASHGTIEQEMRRLHELEALVFRGFRRDMIQKLRRQSIKGKSQIKGKLGLETKTAPGYRSKNYLAGSVSGDLQSDRSKNYLASSVSDDLRSVETEAMLGHEMLASALTQEEIQFKTGSLKHHRVTFSETTGSLSRQPSLPSGTNSTRDSIDDLKSSYSEMSKLSEDSEETLEQGAHSETLRAPPKPQEPNIDFELDVKVFINRGKCVLHTKDNTRDDDPKLMSKLRKEKSWVGGVSDPGSPNMSRRSRENRPMSSSKLRHSTTLLQELTIFHIPGLDVKVHYESRTVPDDGLSPRYSIDHNGIITRKSSTKKASLYAWTTLHSIPEETIISPHILEFLEQTLEPIPAQERLGGGMHAMFDLGSDDPAPMPGQYVYASFPVDVIVYFHMQPSTFRFSCLPVSRVACLLQLPSLHLVFSSKRAEGNTCPEQGVAVGGLSITGCLADFSVYIFHPYGGKKTAGTSGANTSSNTQNLFSPLSDTERKDSLSVNVEFVKLHLSRSRSLTEQARGATIRFSTIVDIGSASFKYDMRRLTEILAFPKAWYRRNIMRRMFLGGDYPTRPSTSVFEPSDFDSSPETELELPLPKTSTPKSDRHRSDLPRDGSLKSPIHSESSTESATSNWNTLVLFAVNFKRLNVHMNMGNVMGNVMLLTKDFRSEGRLSVGSTGHKNLFISLGLGGASLDAKGGIVGGTIEISKVDTFILIKEDPSMEPEHTVGVKLWALELRLDYMGTGVVMTRVSSLEVSLRDEWRVKCSPSGGSTPTRRPALIFLHGNLKWDQLQLMISKSTSTDLAKMYSKLEEFFSQQFKSSKRVFTSLHTSSPGDVPSTSRGGPSKTKKLTPGTRKKHLVQGAPGSNNVTSPDMAWAKHHRHWQPVLAAVSGLRVSHLVTALPSWGSLLGGTLQLRGSHISLACFHGINFKSKSWALFSLKQPCISFATEAQEIRSHDVSEDLDVHIVETLTFSLGISTESPQVHHHSMATVCRLSRNVLFPPQFRTLHEWFHYAFACSEIDAVDRFPSLEREKENLSSSSSSGTGTGHSETVRSRTPKLLEIPNHTREVIFALPSLQLNFETTHLQSSKVPPHNLLLEDSLLKPLVECSFITEFEDHIFVTVDAEAFFFLHDLITSYIKENKDKVVLPLSIGSADKTPRTSSPDSPTLSSSSSTSTRNTSKPESADEKKSNQRALSQQKKSSDEIDELNKRDWRNFHCNTWHLEPTVRLLSWGGKSIEPYGVDYILQKLGFTHARTTIPKWMQRGFMDPLDKVLAVLLLRIVSVVREEPTPAPNRK